MIVWTVYNPPVEAPQSEYTARLFVVLPSGPAPTNKTLTGPLSELRPAFLHRGLTCFDRNPDDDPSILETWL